MILERLFEEYDAINDKIARRSYLASEKYKNYVKNHPGDSRYRDWNDEFDFNDHYDDAKSNVIERFKIIEKMIGRELTDHEQLRIIDFTESGGLWNLDAVDPEKDSGQASSYELKHGRLEKEFFEVVAHAIDYEVFDEFFDRLEEEFDPEEIIIGAGGEPYYYVFRKVREVAKNILLDIVDSKFGSEGYNKVEESTKKRRVKEAATRDEMQFSDKNYSLAKRAIEALNEIEYPETQLSNVISYLCRKYGVDEPQYVAYEEIKLGTEWEKGFAPESPSDRELCKTVEGAKIFSSYGAGEKYRRDRESSFGDNFNEHYACTIVDLESAENFYD